MSRDPQPVTEQVDVYRVRLDLPDAQLAEYKAHLTDEEMIRAARYLSPAKQREFTITRATLRRILARRLDVGPARIRIVHQTHGKPCLDGDESIQRIRFSVSHSHDLALIAVTLDRDIGIDLERIREGIDHAALSQRFFSEAEHAALQACSDADRLRAFYSVWTRKEAVVKAQGDGIALGLKQFDVSVDPHAPPRVLAVRWQQTGIPDWTLITIAAGTGYAACLAASKGNIAVNYHNPQ